MKQMERAGEIRFQPYAEKGDDPPDWGSQGDWHGDEFQNAE